MDERRSKILEAAAALIRKNGSTEFSMQDLAREAGFSLATSYNLIGVKATVLYSLLNRSVGQLENMYRERIAERIDEDELYYQIGMVTTFFVSDPELYRPLIRFLQGIPDSENRPVFMNAAFDFWLDLSSRLSKADQALSLPYEMDSATMMHTFFLGALNRWVHMEIDNEEFDHSIKAAAFLVFFGSAASK